MLGRVIGWAGLIVALLVSNFGLWWSFFTFLLFLSFIFGGLLYLYVNNEECTKKWEQQLTCEVESTEAFSPGLRKVLDEIANLKPLPKCDSRLTGSQLIDENLKDIIGYLIRDYIYQWYDSISDDDEFCYHVRNTGQKVVVLIAARFPSSTPSLTPDEYVKILQTMQK